MEKNDVKNTATEKELEQVAGGSSRYMRYECRICGAVYRNDKELKKHLKDMHPNDPRAKW